MAANSQPPEAFKQIKPYLTLATQLDQRDEKIIAYYCRLYSVQTGMQINRTAPECKKYLAHLMDVLEATKKQFPNEEAISSDVVGQAVVEKYALKIFEKADDDDRQSRFNKNLVKQFYSAGLLFDVLNCFGDLSEDLVVKKQYAKRKAMYLNKCFQTGETPIPGPLIGDGFGDDGLETGADTSNSNPQGEHRYDDYSSPGASHFNQPPVDRPPSSKNKIPSPDRPMSSSKSAHNQYPDAYDDQNLNTNPTSADTELVHKAQKLCKFAQSALQYDDVNTAITNLEQCLALLKTSKRK